MFSTLLLIPQLVQAPKSTGYGFAASVTEAGLFLIPATIGMMLASALAGRLSHSIGPRALLLLGCVAATAAFGLLAATHSERWEIYLSTTILGLGVGFGYASMANLIVEAVPPEQTSVATGMNFIVRSIGGALGAQVAASILAADLGDSDFPSGNAYTIVFVLSAAILAAGVLAGLLIPRHRVEDRPAPTLAFELAE